MEEKRHEWIITSFDPEGDFSQSAMVGSESDVRVHLADLICAAIKEEKRAGTWECDDALRIWCAKLQTILPDGEATVFVADPRSFEFWYGEHACLLVTNRMRKEISLPDAVADAVRKTLGEPDLPIRWGL